MTLGKIKLISGGSIFSDMLQLTVNYKQIKVPKFSFILPQVTVVNNKKNPCHFQEKQTQLLTRPPDSTLFENPATYSFSLSNLWWTNIERKLRRMTTQGKNTTVSGRFYFC
jgi:hypothetical protein